MAWVVCTCIRLGWIGFLSFFSELWHLRLFSRSRTDDSYPKGVLNSHYSQAFTYLGCFWTSTSLGWPHCPTPLLPQEKTFPHSSWNEQNTNHGESNSDGIEPFKHSLYFWRNWLSLSSIGPLDLRKHLYYAVWSDVRLRWVQSGAKKQQVFELIENPLTAVSIQQQFQ